MNNPQTTGTNKNYELPLVISYGWSCPYHGSHQNQVMLASKPHGNKVIGLNTCANQYPNDPVLLTKLYGNLKLNVNLAVKKKGTLK